MAQKFNTLLDAVAYLLKRGYIYNSDYNRFQRDSWYAEIVVQKNGKCKIQTF